MQEKYLGKDFPLNTILYQKNTFIFLFFAIVMAIGLAFQHWPEFYLGLFFLPLIGYGLFFQCFFNGKNQVILPGIPIHYEPFGNENQNFKIIAIIIMINFGLVLILGFDSKIHYQLMDNYGALFVIPYISLYNFAFILLSANIFRDATISVVKLQITLPKAKKMELKQKIKYITLISLLLELIFLIDTLCWMTINTGIWAFSIKTPGYVINTQAIFIISGFAWIIFITQPLAALYIAIQKYFKNIKYSLQLLLKLVELSPKSDLNMKDQLYIMIKLLIQEKNRLLLSHP
jgi:hypothetical protein